MAIRRLTPEPERPLPADPVQWVRDRLGGFLWSRQREILRAVLEHPKVAVKSCHESGKSHCAAIAGAWWVEGHPPGEARIVSTAPSGPQVSSILWTEIGRAHRRGQLRGRILRGQIPRWMVGDEEVGQGRKPADYKDVEQARSMFQGLHARYLLGMLDEAGGIPLWLWQAMDVMATNVNSRLLAIGNPDDPTTQFAQVCKPGSGWHVITISAYDTPNFTGEAIPEQLRESLISRRWVEQTIRDYGEDSAYVQSKVFGEFPEVADDVLITPKMVREAIERDLSGRALKAKAQYGMDIARHGADESVICQERGGMIRCVDSWRGLDLKLATDRARVVLGHDRYARLAIDVVGMGWGVHDPLKHEGFDVVAFVAGATASDPTRFVNLTAEVWWAFREALMEGLIDLDPEDKELHGQLQSRRWSNDPSQRRIMVEPKSKMAERGLHSPDRADAAVLAWWRGAAKLDDVDALVAAAKSADPLDAGSLLTAEW